MSQKNSHLRQLAYVRVLGLVLVLTYHFWPTFLPGGFFGVDIFFVFSGYLITALALTEMHKRGQFDLGKFTQRRFMRIFPTLAFAIMVVLLMTLFAAEEVRYQLREQVFAGLAFISNFYEISTGTSYANDFAPHIWLHLWSLALEVQFYAVWGIMLWLIAKYSKKHTTQVTRGLSVVLLMTSATAMILGNVKGMTHSQLYYSPITHVFPFFFGALLATFAGVQTQPWLTQLSEKVSAKQVKLVASGLAVLLVIMAFSFHFDHAITWRTGFILASIMATLFIFALRVLHNKITIPEPKSIIFFANISYGVYIFHWPLLVMFRAENLSNLEASLLTLGLSIGLATVMFYLIDPILQGKRQFTFTFVKWGSLVASLILLLVPFPALAGSTNQTALEKSLWEANNLQAGLTIRQSQQKLQAPQEAATGPKALIIGDSVTVHTSRELAEKYPAMTVNAKSSRRIDDGLLPELAQVADMGQYDMLIIALGINAVYPDKDQAALEQVVKKYHQTHRIILVTPGKADESKQSEKSKQVAKLEHQLAKKYASVTLADWQKALKGQHDWVAPDSVHPSGYPAGIEGWMKTLDAAIRESNQKI